MSRAPPREGSGRSHDGRETYYTGPALREVVRGAIEGFYASRAAPTQATRPQVTATGTVHDRLGPRRTVWDRRDSHTADRAPALHEPTEPRRGRERKEKGEDYDNPFSYPLSAVYSLVKEEPYITPARPFKETEQSRTSQYYCDYHKQRGHPVDRCIDLQKLMQSLLDRGYLRDFVQDRGEFSTRDKSSFPARRSVHSRLG